MPESIYALLLRLYPAEFRHAYGDEALQLMRDRAHDERGVWRQLRLSADLTRDLLSMRLRRRRGKTAIAMHEARAGVPSFQLPEASRPRLEPLVAGVLLAAVMIVGFTQAIHAFGHDDRVVQLRTLKRLRAGIVQSGRPAFQAPAAQTAPPSGPAARFIAKLLENRFGLSVRDGQLSGSGAPVLHVAIEQSRFVVLGEDHGNAQTPEFWGAVCNAAGPAGFHTMAVEEGPLAAAELEGWARQSDGLARFEAFQKNFPESVQIYNAREEFEMLQRCARASQGAFRLWGLNQEALGGAGLALSRVLASRIGKDARTAVEQLVQKNDDAYRKAVLSASIFDLFMIAADDTELAAAAARLQKDGSAEAQALFQTFVESHEINRASPADYGNARRRERLMKTRFAANYARAASAASAPPKVLLKFGGYHGYRGLNPVHGSGIGNYVAELADAQSAQSLHIRFMPLRGSQPIHPRVGQPQQLRPFDYETDRGAAYLQPMFGNLLPSEWTMFDLRPLRQELARPGAVTDPNMAALVFGYDVLVIVPDARASTEIR